MKKLLYLFALLTIFVSGTNAQTTTTATYGKGNGTFYKADGTATSTGFDAKTFVSNTTPAVTITCSYDNGLNSLDAVNGARLGANDGDNTYTISVPDGYLITGYTLDCWAVNASHPAKTLTVEDGTSYNVSSATSQTVSVTGLSSQSTYFTIKTTGWSPIKTNNFKIYVKENRFNIVYNCYDENDQFLESVVSEEKYNDGATVDVSGFTHDIPGYTLQSITPTSVTIDGANAEVKVVYAAASSFDYTVVINAANPLGTVITTEAVPAGTSVTIKGAAVANGDNVSYNEAVTESDVVVTFPSGYEYMAADVTISGATITVDCYDPRWPIIFDKTQTFTRSDRCINNASFNGQIVDGIYENTSTTCYQDLTATKTVVLPADASIKPSFSMKGGWQHGFVYIDLNNDGDFTDDGELVAKYNEGNPNLSTAIPAFISPAAGTYRMRFKSDWASEDPRGNEGDGNGKNFIIDNGGMIVDVTLKTVSQFFRLYAQEESAYLQGDGTLTYDDATDKASIWYYDGTKLYNFSGNFNSAVQFSKAASAGYYSITAGEALEKSFSIVEDVDALPVTISSAGFATLYAPVALTIPASVEVYTATDDDDKYLHLNEIQGQTIPANTGVILEGEAGTYNFDLTDDVTPISNALTGTIAAIARPEGSYILATGSAGVAFYKDGAQTIPGFKAYLAASTGSDVKTFVFGDETAVKAIEAAQNSDKVVYDMSGRRVLNPAKGLYILNGKKVVIK